MKRIRWYAIMTGVILSALVIILCVAPGKRETISGKVLANGRALPGAGIYLVEYSPPYRYQNTVKVEKVAATGKDGSFSFRLRKERLEITVQTIPALVAYSPDHALRVASLSGSIDRRSIRFELRKAVTITGTVRDRNGKPVRGAVVRATRVSTDSVDPACWDNRWPPENLKARADDRGRYILPNLPGESLVNLSAVAPGYSLQYRYEVTSGQTGVDFTLPREGVIEGKVTFSHNGMPVRGVRVCIPTGAALLEAQVAKTDYRGHYRILSVPPGMHTVAVLTEPGFPKWTARDTSFIDVNEGKTTAGVDLRLIRGGVITGKIMDRESGNPVSGVTVYAGQSSRVPGRGISDGRGEYHLRVPPGEKVIVYTSALLNEYPFAWRDTTLKITDGETVRGVDFGFKKGITLTGKVFSPEGKPEAGVEITPDRDAGETAWYGRAISDSAGTFVLNNVADGGTVRLVAGKKELSLIGRAAFRTGDTIAVRLSRYSGAEVQGRILDEERRPVWNAHVRLNMNGAWTDSAGVFQFRNLKSDEPGVVTVEAYGYKRRSFSLPEWKGNVLRLGDIIILRTDRWIAGTVVDSGGKPMEGALVEVITGCCREHVEARTDAVGRFRLEGLMHLVEPMVGIHLGRTGYRSFRYITTNESHRFVITKNPPAHPRDNSRFDWKKAEKAWRSFEGSYAPPLRVSRWLNGGPVDLKELRGKLVVLHFWSSDRPESAESLRLAETLHRRYERAGVCVIGIHPYTADVERVRSVLKEKGITCRVAIDRQASRNGARGRTFEEYQSGSYPFQGEWAYSVLIDRTGRVNLSGLAKDDHTVVTPKLSEIDGQNDIESKIRRLYRTSEY